MNATKALLTFEIEGPGYIGGYYTPAEEWPRADTTARWLARALHDFGAITGDKEDQTERHARELAPLIEQVTTTHTWVEGGHTVTVIRMHPSASQPDRMGSMQARRQIRRRQRQLAGNAPQ
ncbi:hypothetical protein FIV07_27975 (plasmid) [Mycobacterium sp. THAF192]|nr:hypothetical protein FIV07_27975 [Mycobacterium sp. THAF192]